MKVNEIFLSVSGEGGHFPQGSWCVFVRFAGCNLRCKWCDTVRAQREEDGTEMSPKEILSEIRKFEVYRNLDRVLLTGGEPLTQDWEELKELISDLTERDYDVQIETNGSIYLPNWGQAKYLFWVIDYKPPSSGMNGTMIDISEYEWYLRQSNAWLKFVVADEKDYAKALSIPYIRDFPTIMFSACPPLTHATLFEWMKRDGLTNIRLNVQIHKIVGLNEQDSSVNS